MKTVKLINAVLALFVSFLFFLTPAYAKTVTGIVYNDANRNGRLDKKEEGVRNVAVSNGTSVVLTDRKGRYKIDIENNGTLFITKPSGYALEEGSNNIPRFFS